MHIHKTGGSSVQKALKEFGSHSSDALPIHPTAMQVRDLIAGHNVNGIVAERYPVIASNPQAWADYFTFAIVRNPWDWAVSLYAWLLQNRVHDMAPFARELGSFDRWVRYLCEPDLTGRVFRDGARETYRRPQWDSVSDKGHLIVKFVGRLENLDADFRTICDRIGLRAELPHTNVSRHPPYRLCYTPETRRLIGDLYRADVEAFGYKF